MNQCRLELARQLLVIEALTHDSAVLNKSGEVESKNLERTAGKRSLDHAAPAPLGRRGRKRHVWPHSTGTIGRVLAIGMLNSHSRVGASMSFAALFRERP